jgi:hypothetical protein
MHLLFTAFQEGELSAQVENSPPQLTICLTQLKTRVLNRLTLLYTYYARLSFFFFARLADSTNALVGGHPGPRKKADEHSSTR